MELDTSSPSRLQLTVNSCQENADQCQIVDAKEDPLTVAGASSFNKKSSPLDIDKLMTETSSQEFFEILDGASAEDLDVILRAMNLGIRKDSFSVRLAKSWQRVIAVPAEPRNFFSILRWWESRRAFYNAIVGSVGMFMAALVCWHYQLYGGLLLYALFVCMGYAIFCNLCYSLGLPAELILRSIKKFDRYGPILLTLGLVLSIVFVISLGITMLTGFVLQG